MSDAHSQATQRRWRDPAYRTRVRAAMKKIPDMTPQQRAIYKKLRPILGRKVALEEAMK